MTEAGATDDNARLLKAVRLYSELGFSPVKTLAQLCRAGFAVSFALVPPDKASVDDQKTKVSLNDILTGTFCGEERFWDISRAIMADASGAIAMFWQDAWCDFVKGADDES